MNKRKSFTGFVKHIDQQYRQQKPSPSDRFVQNKKIIRLGVMLEEIRKSKKLTQQQLADKCGTSKTYISRIENGASEIRLSTLIRIIHQGFKGQLVLTVKLKNNISTFKF